MKDVPAAVVATEIAIAGVADVDAARAAVLEEVTVVAIPAAVAADAEEGRLARETTRVERRGLPRLSPLNNFVFKKGRSDAALFL